MQTTCAGCYVEPVRPGPWHVPWCEHYDPTVPSKEMCFGCQRNDPTGHRHAAWCGSYRTMEGITLDEHWQRRGYQSHAHRVLSVLSGGA